MSEPDSSGIPEARRRRTLWPGWVWLIPLVALGFAGWLAYEERVVGPRTLTVHFADVGGIKPGAPVRYRGVQVGSVENISVDEDLQGATLVLDMNALEGRLGEETRVWIARPSLAPHEIGNIISGAYLAIEPGGEGEVDELVGLEQPPIVVPEGPGRMFVLVEEEAGGLVRGAPVRFRGIEVGRVLGTRFDDDRAIEVPIFVQGAHAELVREATVFWRAGGLALDGGAGGMQVDLPSLGAIATGAVAFENPPASSSEEASAPCPTGRAPVRSRSAHRPCRAGTPCVQVRCHRLGALRSLLPGRALLAVGCWGAVWFRGIGTRMNCCWQAPLALQDEDDPLGSCAARCGIIRLHPR